MLIYFAKKRVVCSKCKDTVKLDDPYIFFWRGKFKDSYHFSCVERYPDLLGEYKSMIVTRLRITMRACKRWISIYNKSVNLKTKQLKRIQEILDIKQKMLQIELNKVDKLTDLEKNFKYRYLNAQLVDNKPIEEKEKKLRKPIDTTLRTQKFIEKSLYNGLKGAVNNAIDVKAAQ